MSDILDLMQRMGAAPQVGPAGVACFVPEHELKVESVRCML